MNKKLIRELIRIVEESQIDSLEIRRLFRTIRITKSRSTNNHSPADAGPTVLVPLPTPGAAAGVPVTGAPPVPSHLVEIKSPMVGTFYRAPAPGAPSFVEVGQVVKPGDVLCIIEAMKLMNEIEAEQAGKIVRILVENAQPIEFGQPLFLLDPAAV